MSCPIRLPRRHLINCCLVGFCSLIGWLCGCGHQSNKASSTNDQPTASKTAFTAEELLNELRIRAARNRLAHDKGKAGIRSDEVSPGKPSFPQSDPRLKDLSTESIYDQLIQIQVQYMGTTGRKEWYEVDQSYKDDAKSVLCLVKSSELGKLQDTPAKYQVHYQKFGVKHNLCQEEKFRDEPAAAFCSGVLVGPQLIATADHCLDEEPDVTKIRFLFGFKMNGENSPQITFSQDEVYAGKLVISDRNNPIGADWALIELDRPVTGDHPPKTVRRSGKIPDGEAVYAIGYPNGLPVKVSGGAVVRDNKQLEIFVSNLDAYTGSSGSPVFNSSHIVEGILSRGERDFVEVQQCNRSLVCPNTGCRGEDCTRVTEFAKLIPSYMPQ
jgi:V8-like Glu-specific endopeptidase